MRNLMLTTRTGIKYSMLVGTLALLLAANAADEASTDRSELSALLSADSNAGFAMAKEPRDFSFPRDHGPHPEYRNEWWYVTGNLDAENGRRFGFELTFFRFALTPDQPLSDSAWRSNQVYIAHFAVTDADGEDFYVAERFSRGAARSRRIRGRAVSGLD